jgi:hypothetical protein
MSQNPFQDLQKKQKRHKHKSLHLIELLWSLNYKNRRKLSIVLNFTNPLSLEIMAL